VITIDGPTASGKGTLAAAVAERLGYHLLDSGSLYRATALAARRAVDRCRRRIGVAQVAAGLKLRFEGDLRVFGRRRGHRCCARRPSAWPRASRPGRRCARRCTNCSVSFRRLPGLVADGRDMGTVVFPDAALKVFLTASAAARAERRHKQLISKGIPANIDSLRADLEARDARDRSRSTAPLKPAEDALELDNSGPQHRGIGASGAGLVAAAQAVRSSFPAEARPGRAPLRSPPPVRPPWVWDFCFNPPRRLLPHHPPASPHLARRHQETPMSQTHSPFAPPWWRIFAALFEESLRTPTCAPAKSSLPKWCASSTTSWWSTPA
jgi:cytidylate kinase